MVVLAHEHQNFALDDPVWRDVGCEDLRWMFDYWRYGDEPLPLGFMSHQESDSSMEVVEIRNPAGMENVKAVMIASEWERGMAGGTFSEVDIGPNHPVWREKPTQISVKMGLPLLMHKFPVQSIQEGEEDSLFRNPEASALNYIVELGDPDWGCIADEFSGTIGSVLIVRADKKDLQPRQVEMLAAYCGAGLGYSMAIAVSGNSENLKETVMKEMMDKSIFHLFFEIGKQRYREKDPSWDNLQSPYKT